MYIGEEFLTFNILLCAKNVPKLIHWLCKPIIIASPIKTGFSIRNLLFPFFVVRVWIEMAYFLFEKQILIGFLKVIAIIAYLFQEKWVTIFKIHSFSKNEAHFSHENCVKIYNFRDNIMKQLLMKIRWIVQR